MSDRTRTIILGILGGLIAGLMLVLIVVLLTSGDDDPAAGTTSTTAATSTTAGTTSAPTTAAPTTTATTQAATTTTVPATTTMTTEPFDGDTATKSNTTVSGSPGRLVDVRVGGHEGFTRIVFEFDGDGVPWWTVGYTDVIAGGGSGEPCPIAGAAILEVQVQPGSAFWVDQTYFGPLTIEPGLGSVVQVKYCEDFEAALQYGIGVDGMKDFDAFTLDGPQRLVVDIAD